MDSLNSIIDGLLFPQEGLVPTYFQLHVGYRHKADCKGILPEEARAKRKCIPDGIETGFCEGVHT